MGFLKISQTDASPKGSMTYFKENPTMTLCWMMLLVVAFVTTDAGAEVVSLQEPIKGLKKEMFGGWMHVVQIMACVVGAVVSVAKQSPVPLGVGAVITAGIKFFETFLGDAGGALLP